jgi:hypothetical protein
MEIIGNSSIKNGISYDAIFIFFNLLDRTRISPIGSLFINLSFFIPSIMAPGSARAIFQAAFLKTMHLPEHLNYMFRREPP